MMGLEMFCQTGLAVMFGGEMHNADMVNVLG